MEHLILSFSSEEKVAWIEWNGYIGFIQLTQSCLGLGVLGWLILAGTQFLCFGNAGHIFQGKLVFHFFKLSVCFDDDICKAYGWGCI